MENAVNVRKDIMKKVKRVVIKVGSSTLTHSTGLINLRSLEGIVRQITDLHNRGIELVLVTSGAVAAGMGKLGLKSKPNTIPEKQAAAAVGQGVLLHMYEKLFSEYGKTVAQILLTKDDINHRTRYLNARNTFFALFEQGSIPIVNENDAIVVDEIKFGDNDTLSAMVATLVEADLLIILSDIDGLYDCNPRDNPAASLISYVKKITKEIEACAGTAGSKLGTGGMITKIRAAKIAVSGGSSMVIVNGSNTSSIYTVLQGENIGTFFEAKQKPLQPKKHWIAYATETKGKAYIDEGAIKALIFDNKSLLPSGITKVEGSFSQGQVISLYDKNNLIVAKGITNYGSEDLKEIMGLKSAEIVSKLGFKHYDEVIHVNNLAILKNPM